MYIYINITTCYSHQSDGQTLLRCATCTASAHASVGSDCSLQRCHSAQNSISLMEKMGISMGYTTNYYDLDVSQNAG